MAFTIGDSIKTALSKALRVLSLKRFWQIKFARLLSSSSEPEMALIPILAIAERRSLDIGASFGVYAAKMVRWSSAVVAFEPRESAAAALSEMATVLGLPMRVEAVALSDRTGVATLRMLTEDLGRSTIEASNVLKDPDCSGHSECEVKTLCLDDYGFRDVGLIKIDVEGHEIAVLSGSTQTVDACRCAFIIEAEDRHLAGTTEKVIEWMQDRNYAGFFLLQEHVVPIQLFSVEAHQNESNIGGWRTKWARTGIYVNNFIFVPAERKDSFETGYVALGFKPFSWGST